MNSTSEKLRVLHLIDSLGSGGAERLLHTNLAHINEELFQNEVVTVLSNSEYWKKPIMDLGVSVHSLECSGHREILSGVRRLKKHVDRTRPHLIHTHLFAANVIGRLTGTSRAIPVISSIHNPEYEPEAVAGASTSIRAKVRAARLIDKATATYCARMVAVSAYTKERAAARLGFPISKIDVIYNPVQFDSNLLPGRNAVRENLGFGSDTVIVLNVGRLSPQKGFLDAVRAWPKIHAANPFAVLISVGGMSDVNYRSRVENEISRLGLNGSIKLLGERRDVHELMSASDLFLFPSLFEGLGIALVEAMAAGTACVASNIAPITEFITQGENGVLVPPGDPEAISSEVISLMNDPVRRTRIVDAARKTARDMFDPVAAAEKLQSVYWKVLGKRADD